MFEYKVSFISTMSKGLVVEVTKTPKGLLRVIGWKESTYPVLCRTDFLIRAFYRQNGREINISSKEYQSINRAIDVFINSI
jgi:hypothetical protein